ncbi:tRNA lysidine(34) synthetase TilS [Pseudotenacibaculum haliotis]|uniref:tRNA(Ile)-lysidine synthase n=1 Tax=Pseudotenacibaculum haliotis TaxID=1862138 RepID=A0ABW5LUE6_9FLAO
MLLNFQKHIDTHFSFLKSQKLLIAVSGGIDSVVLAHLAHQTNLDFALGHCNFQLREEESDGDELFVKELAQKLGVQVYTTKFATETYAQEHKLSIQVAARNLRYEWFYQLLKEQGYQYVLTGHNTNDNLETFLINLTRGTGLEGLTGIPPVNDQTVRPLLAFSRDEIKMYAIKNEIEWREDRSNASVKYVRNKVRHQILPVLQDINPHILETFKKSLEHLNESQQIINDRVQEVSKDLITTEGNITRINLKKLNKSSHKKAYLYQILHTYGFSEWNDVLDLVSAQSGKQLFSATHRLVKDRDYLLLVEIDTKGTEKSSYLIKEGVPYISTPIPMKIESTLQDKAENSDEIIVDSDLISFPLILRKWKHGDIMYPTGMSGSKKISQLFKDKKLSLLEKENCWILTSYENEIIWVVGLRQDRRFLTNSQTLTKVKLSLTY